MIKQAERPCNACDVDKYTKIVTSRGIHYTVSPNCKQTQRLILETTLAFMDV